MDYYQSGSLTQTFKNVYRVSIVKDLDTINIPTLILWGENDTITPLADGKYMHEHIKNSKLFIVSEATHKLPYEKPQEFADAVLSFLE
jgi:triacylglycerol lipase